MEPRKDPISGKVLTAEQLACPIGKMISVCADCGKVNGYVPADRPEYSGCYSHGLCSACCKKRIAEIKEIT